MLKKILAVSLVAVLAAMMSGCVVAVPYIIAGENEANKFPGIVVEVGEVKMKAGANVAVLKAAKLSAAVFEKDMVTPNTSLRPSDVKVNATVADEVTRTLSLAGNTATPVTVRLKTLYTDSRPIDWYYRSVTERNVLGFFQSGRIRKLVNTHGLTLEQGGDTLLEVHGLWVSGNQGDEIAGARQLAKEIVSEVLKKLSVTSAPPRESVAEAETKKE